MITMRGLLVGLVLVVSCNAHAQTREIARVVPASVAIGEAAWTPFIMTFDNGAGVPAAGYPYTWVAEGCGTFEGGTQESGITDENGQAVSSTFYGVALDLGCHVWLLMNDISWLHLVRVYDPASIVMVPDRTELQTLTDFDYQVWIYMRDTDGTGVAEGPPAVLNVGQSQSGATAVATAATCYPNPGLCTMGFRSNGRAGTYRIDFGYHQQTLTVSVKQRHN